MKTMLKTALLVLATSSSLFAMAPDDQRDQNLGLSQMRQRLKDVQQNPANFLAEIQAFRTELFQQQTQRQNFINQLPQFMNIPTSNMGMNIGTIQASFKEDDEYIQTTLYNPINELLIQNGYAAPYAPPMNNPVYPAAGMMPGMPGCPYPAAGMPGVGMPAPVPPHHPMFPPVPGEINDPIQRSLAVLIQYGAHVSQTLQPGTYIDIDVNGMKMSVHKKSH